MQRKEPPPRGDAPERPTERDPTSASVCSRYEDGAEDHCRVPDEIISLSSCSEAEDASETTTNAPDQNHASLQYESARGLENQTAGRKRKRSLSRTPPKKRSKSNPTSEAAPSTVRRLSTVAPDRVPRQRRSSTSNERASIAASATTEINLLPNFPVREAAHWDAILAELDLYEAQHHVHYRARDSRKTITYNKKTKVPVPTCFEWAFRVFRCTHGCYQKSRSNGKRQHSVRYVGCPARFTAAVVNVSGVWKILVKNETRTHTHPLSPEISSSYLGAASVDVRPDVLDTLASMVDARAELRCITAFLSDSLGRPVTPQQARNVVTRLQSRSSPEITLKSMLDALSNHEGADVAVLKDELGITIGIVTQTAYQKRCFELWGDSLVMDWTHGTNNLGYHLGGLVVTTSTGRGIPVVDFLASNEKFDTTQAIFEFFKDKNPRWPSIQSFVIDKDFVEWAVIEACFPDAKVLLCQFHAMTYWRKIISQRSYNLKLAQRDALEAMFIGMLKSYTKSMFEERYADFSNFCRDEVPALLKYFDENGKPCVDMWVNYARGQFFSAGNTTTNRIESNWRQVKEFIGDRPRIDKCFGGLLAHQLAVTRQFASALDWHASHSRQHGAVPKFLRSASARLSDYTYALVRKELDILHNDMPNATCEDIGDHKWQVNTSIRLPCRHLMLVVRDGLHKLYLPDEAVDNRWCMMAARSLCAGFFTASCVALTSVLGLIKLCPPAFHFSGPAAPRAIQSLMEDLESDTTRKQDKVSYVRLRSGEQADMVVLSESEKYRYARAATEDMLDTMSRLSTQEFYKRLAELKNLASWFCVRLRNSADSSITSNGVEDTTECETDDCQLIDQFDAAQEIQENDEPRDAVETIQFQECSGPYKRRGKTTSEAGRPISRLPCGLLNIQGAESPIASVVAEESRPTVAGVESSGHSSSSGIAVLQLQALQPRKGSQKKAKQTRIRTKKDRFAIQTWPSTPVTVAELIRWSQCAQDIKLVQRAFDSYPVKMTDKFLEGREPQCSREPTRLADFDYNFVVPQTLAKTLERVLDVERKHEERLAARQQQANRLGTMLQHAHDNSRAGEHDFVLSYPGDLPRFSSRAIFRMRHFYELKKTLSAWEKDMLWLQRAWKTSAEVELFSLEVGNDDTVDNRNKVCASQVIAKYRNACLHTEYRLPSGLRTLKFDSVVGFVARDWLLSDSVVLMCLQGLCDTRNGVKLLNVLVNMVEWPQTPLDMATEQVEDITKARFIVLPVNVSNTHWMLIIAKVHYGSEITVYFYDPLCGAKSVLEQEWEEGMLPFLIKWHDDFNLEIASWNTAAGMPHEPVRCTLAFPPVKKVWLKTPKQSDASSCGVCVIAQAHAVLNGANGFGRISRLPADFTMLLRLRILWYITCYCSEHQPPPERFASCIETHAEILQRLDQID